MDVALLLILPVIGGHFLANRWNCTKFFCAREDGHRLYFRAALLGFFLFALAYAMRTGLLYLSDYADFEKFGRGILIPLVKDSSTKSNEDSPQVVITAIYSLILGLVLPSILNFFFKKEAWLMKAISNNEFELLLNRAIREKKPISLTMENNKVYVGVIFRTIDPTQARKNLGLIPIMSGYRNADSKIVFTTYYGKIYNKIRQANSGLGHLSRKDFEIVIPVEKIHSTNLFDIIAYEAFQNQNRTQKDDKKAQSRKSNK